MNRFQRQLSLLGENSPSLLSAKKVMVCGLGGVGGSVLECLTRAGVGTFILVDNDTFDPTNLNRQILCTENDIGRQKTAVAAERVRAINKEARCVELPIFLTADNIPRLLAELSPDYIADAIDNISAKVALAKQAEVLGIPLISSMGTGNKLDPTRFECADIYSTSVCPLAKCMRKLLKENGVEKLKVVYSKEVPKASGKTVSSVSFVPNAAGAVIAGEILKDLCNINHS